VSHYESILCVIVGRTMELCVIMKYISSVQERKNGICAKSAKET
jgi:hypothetical protein